MVGKRRAEAMETSSFLMGRSFCQGWKPGLVILTW